MRVLRLPPPEVFQKTVHVVTGFGGQVVLYLPEFVKNRIRFHKLNLPSIQEGRKPSAISNPLALPPLRGAAEFGRWPGDGSSRPIRFPSPEPPPVPRVLLIGRREQIPARAGHQQTDETGFQIKYSHSGHKGLTPSPPGFTAARRGQ